MNYSLSHSYKISETLLRQWPSKQKYDAEVEALTAWDLISTNQTGLIAPTKPPTPPTNPTIYVTQQVTFCFVPFFSPYKSMNFISFIIFQFLYIYIDCKLSINCRKQLMVHELLWIYSGMNQWNGMVKHWVI